MECGYINFFDPIKGYGFIRREKGRDVIFRTEDISDDKYIMEIPKGINVEFNTVKTNKGLKAIDIQFI
ncbi:retron Se72 family effector protein [Proteus mirabilis]|uniref:retron Se72 family effector protein n=1 Tax=Enterobacterales TaxID=91347 RepID=UPI0008480928|nr:MULTISPECIES: retron Se72 family effector protein [Enterobacterales]EJD6045139.1 retron Se72 family effector protein [Providencia rettgeri]NHX32910.1 cold shock domain-containing protein [Escherichia coli]ELR5127771.1 retron Se72 family effector protein [Providencia rettgeri]ELS4585962.1 retron Se72 family effector protein [Providencia rettgeri]MCT8233086.1 retron Se72 family effector protein [Proteus terrae]